MIKMITATCLICALTALPSHAEEVYKRVDENGTPSFSDTSSKGAEKIIVEPVNVQKIPPFTAQPSNYSAPTETAVQYDKLEITSPADQTTLRNQHSISVQAAVKPGLRSGHKIEFLDNGQPLQPAGQQLSIQILDFERGNHSLSVRILDNQDKVIQASDPVTVYVFRAVIKPPPASNP